MEILKSYESITYKPKSLARSVGNWFVR